jgi:hypothetical protein
VPLGEGLLRASLSVAKTSFALRHIHPPFRLAPHAFLHFLIFGERREKRREWMSPRAKLVLAKARQRRAEAFAKGDIRSLRVLLRYHLFAHMRM